MTKLAASKLKNNPLSFWSFLAVLQTHALNMDWTEILQFTITRTTQNILEYFAMIELDTVIIAVQAQINRTTANLER